MSDSDQPTSGQSSWITAIGSGAAVCLLAAIMLSLTVRVCWPELVDESSTSSTRAGCSSGPCLSALACERP